MPTAKKTTVASTKMMSMTLPMDGAVESDDQRDDEQVLCRCQMIVRAGEKSPAAAPRIVDAIFGAHDRLSGGAELRAILASGREREHALRKSGPAPVAIPGDLRPYRRARWTGDRPMHRQLRRYPERLRSVHAVDAFA